MPPIRRLVVVPALAAALTLAGCAASPSASDDGTFTIVTSTTVYAQIAEEIAGDAATVTPIVDSASRDPHEYEATATDQLTVASADLIVVNGGGYDTFVDTLVDATGSTAPVIVAVDSSPAWIEASGGDHDGADEHDHAINEHVWYDPEAMRALAAAIADELGTLLPADADAFDSNLADFAAGLDELDTGLADIAAAHTGAEVFATEPVAGYLLAAAGLDDVTPADFSEAVEEGQDVPPATLLDVLSLLGDGQLSVVVANAQTGGAETTAVIDAATDAGIPVLEFTETLPDGQTYLQWMQQNVTDLAEALTP